MPEAGLKAISLWQPWASAVALGVKRVETRSWSTAYRGPLAIHAAKTTKGWELANVQMQFEISSVCPTLHPRYSAQRHGAVLAIAELLDVVPMTLELIAQQSALELLAGDWRVGRFAWIFGVVEPLEPPIGARGRQGLFEIEL